MVDRNFMNALTRRNNFNIKTALSGLFLELPEVQPW